MEIIENKLLKEKLYHQVLDSGLNLFFMPKKGFTKKYAILATDYGSNDLEFVSPFDGKKISLNHGIAHFLEHKMFEQPDGADAFAKFSEFGANANAFTNFNMTAYLFSCTDNFEPALEHLINFVQTPHFTDENVEKEKGIIGQEIKMYEDNSDWRLFFNTLKAMYVNHPNRIDIAGTVESIGEITKEELYACYNSFYSPSNMAMFVIGDLKWEEILEQVKSTISDQNKFEGHIKRLGEKEPKAVSQSKIVDYMEVSMPMFSIGYKDYVPENINGKDLLRKTIITDLILDIIFKKGSELNEELYMQGYIFEPLSCDYSSHLDFGYTTIMGETNDVEATIEKIKLKLEELKVTGIEKEDFERIIKAKIGGFIRSFDSIEHIANTFLGYFFEGINYFDILEAFESIEIEDLNTRIKEHFNSEAEVISLILPIEK